MRQHISADFRVGPGSYGQIPPTPPDVSNSLMRFLEHPYAARADCRQPPSATHSEEAQWQGWRARRLSPVSPSRTGYPAPPSLSWVPWARVPHRPGQDTHLALGTMLSQDCHLSIRGRFTRRWLPHTLPASTKRQTALPGCRVAPVNACPAPAPRWGSDPSPKRGQSCCLPFLQSTFPPVGGGSRGWGQRIPVLSEALACPKALGVVPSGPILNSDSWLLPFWLSVSFWLLASRFSLLASDSWLLPFCLILASGFWLLTSDSSPPGTGSGVESVTPPSHAADWPPDSHEHPRVDSILTYGFTAG